MLCVNNLLFIFLLDVVCTHFSDCFFFPSNCEKWKRIKIIIFKNVRFCFLFCHQTHAALEVIVLCLNRHRITIERSPELMIFGKRIGKRNNQKVSFLLTVATTLGRMNVKTKVMTNSVYIVIHSVVIIFFFVSNRMKHDMYSSAYRDCCYWLLDAM